MQKIKKLLLSLCTIVGALFITGCVLLLVIGYNNHGAKITEHSMLTINFNENISEVVSYGLLDELFEQQNIKLQNVIEAIEMGASDPRIDGILAQINISGLELAQIQDIARAIEGFKKSGKQTIVFSQGFGPLGQGNREYYLASFFDKIYMQPHTTIGLTGISIEIPFARNALDKFGIDPEFYTRYEYKSAMMSLTDKKISEPYKNEMQRLGKSLMTQLKADIVNNRKLTENIDVIINKAPIFAEEGKKLNLIDDLLYLPQLEQKLKEQGITNFISVNDYAEQIYPNKGELPTIAILNLNGVIDVGESSADNLKGEYTIGSASVLSDLSEIADIPDLRALIVRIDSPGGSYNAADEIYFALQEFKAKHKIPIIVSQSGYAASGGYFVSLAGDSIVAEPTTITGSIGVLGGKIVLQKLWQKIGINWDSINIGTNADIMSMNRRFSNTELEIFNASLDEVYKDFTAKVVANRPLKKNIDEIARGRVWTGMEAYNLGLVDVIGGLDDAIFLAKEKGNIDLNARFKLVSFPLAKSFSEKLQSLLLKGNVSTPYLLSKSSVDIRYLKLFKHWQYDTVLVPFEINM